MSRHNVPQHTPSPRSRHGVRNRASHDYDAYANGRNDNLQTVDQEVIDGVLGPGDIRPGSIDFPAFAEGAYIRNLINGPATVTIDDTGVTIEDGALTLKDEFGETVLVASGFAGTWADFINAGLYNALFGAGAVGVLPVGRTASLPYWTYTKAVGSPTLTRMVLPAYPSGYALKGTFAALGDSVEVLSDPVPVRGGQVYSASMMYGGAVVGGTDIDLSVQIRWYSASLAFLSSTTTNTGITGPISPLNELLTSGLGATAPAEARYAAIRLKATETLFHSASNEIYFGYATFQQVPLVLDDEQDYVVHGITADSAQFGNPAGDTTLISEIDGAITQYRGNTFDTYTPTVSNGGTATFTVREGWYIKLGAMVFVGIELIVNAAGSGATPITISLPVTPSFGAGSRQVITGYFEAMAAGFNGVGFGVLDTSNNRIERVRNDDGTNVTGADLLNLTRIVLQGWYRA